MNRLIEQMARTSRRRLRLNPCAPITRRLTHTAFETPPAGNGTRAPPGTPGIGMAARVTI